MLFRSHNIEKLLPSRLTILLTQVCLCRTNRICDVVDHYRSSSAPVIHGSQAVIPLLPCRVPYLKLDCLIVHCQGLREESRPDGRFLQPNEATNSSFHSTPRTPAQFIFRPTGPHVKEYGISPGIRRTGLSQTGEPGWTCRRPHPREEPSDTTKQSKQARISIAELKVAVQDKKP